MSTQICDGHVVSKADGFGLACQECGLVFDDGATMGVVQAHFEVEHEASSVRLDMVVLCDRCGKPMEHLATIGNKHHYQCEPCHRGRVVTQNVSRGGPK